MNLSIKKRLFLILFLLGMAGVVSLLLVDFSAALALVPSQEEIPRMTPLIKVLSLIQPALILAVAVLLGVILAHRVGLAAPFAEALAARGDALSALRPQVLPGLVGGVLGGLGIVLITSFFKPLFSPEMVDRISRFGLLMPVPTRLLYGGITEELLLRWGFMSLLVWVVWRLFQNRRSNPTAAVFVAAILISSFVFGVAHLPVAFLLLPEATIVVVLFVIIANSAFGLIAGALYWRRGLESAIVAHMITHLVLLAATYAGAYF
jgi:hypothetical protein